MEVSEKGGNSSIRVTSTVPLLCDHNYTSSCCIFLMVDVDGPRSEYKGNCRKRPKLYLCLSEVLVWLCFT